MSTWGLRLVEFSPPTKAKRGPHVLKVMDKRI